MTQNSNITKGDLLAFTKTIEKTFKESIEKLEARFDKLEARFDKLEDRFDKLEDSYNGYIKKEGIIYENKSNESFTIYLNKKNIQYKQLYIENFYGPDNQNPITDFDGCFLINYGNQKINTNKRLCNTYSIRGLIPPNNLLIKQNVALSKNTLMKIVIIEAKHDIDKSKIDGKLLQFIKISEILNNNYKSNNSTLNNSTLNNNFKNMIYDEDFKELKDNYFHIRDTQLNNINIYFSANNWTMNLQEYINDINNNNITEEMYIEHTNKIINSDDKKLVISVKKAGNKAKSYYLDNKADLDLDIYKDIDIYINNFKSEYEYINNFNYTNNKKKDLNPIEEYCNIMKHLKTFTTPFDDLKLQNWNNKLGIISNNTVICEKTYLKNV
jgi:hypothetical protein